MTTSQSGGFVKYPKTFWLSSFYSKSKIRMATTQNWYASCLICVPSGPKSASGKAAGANHNLNFQPGMKMNWTGMHLFVSILCCDIACCMYRVIVKLRHAISMIKTPVVLPLNTACNILLLILFCWCCFPLCNSLYKPYNVVSVNETLNKGL